MKGKNLLLGILAITLVFTLTAVGCDNNPTDNNDLKTLSGDVTISPSANVTTGMELTAAYSGREPVTYLWKRNGTAVPGETTNKYTPPTSGIYTVTLSAAGYNSKISAPVTVTGAALSTLSGNVTISPSANVTTGMELTAAYSGSETVDYQWKNGAANVGENSAKYTPIEAGIYTVTLRASGYISKTSAPVTVTVIVLPDLPGNVTISPSGEVNAGTELTAAYSGSETVSYQWKRNGTAVPGATSIKYTPTEGGSYTVTLSAAGYNSKTSAAVTVPLPPLAGTVSITGSADAGQPLTANTASLGGSGTISYQWKRGANDIGTNSSVYFVQAADIGSTITVSVTRSGNLGSVTSAPTAVVTGGVSGTPGLAFTPNGTGYSVSRGTASAAEVVIPAVHEGLSVTQIDVRGFQNYTSMTSISIPYTVASISNQAFYGCSRLTSVTIPNSVTNIGDSAFQDSGLTSVTIPNSVMNVGVMAFAGCKDLTSVTIGNSVTGIGNYMFFGCSGLTDLTIGSGVTSIVLNAFQGCGGLSNITVNGNNPNYSSKDGILYNKAGTGLIVGIKGDVIIPAGVTSIGERAFESRSLTSITMDSVTSIGNSAFRNCSLTSVTIGSRVTSIGEYAFSGCTILTSATIPNSVTSIGGSVFSGCTILTAITVGTGNTEYTAENGILYNKNKTALVAYPTATGTFIIPDSITSIGGGAFGGCTDLTGVNIPDSVTSIGGSAFNGTALFNNQPDGVVYVGKWAYTYKGDMPADTSITLLDGTKGIAGSAFYDRDRLLSVTIPGSVTFINGSAFSGCINLTSVTFQGTIRLENFSSSNPFPGDLRAKYLDATGGIGRYTRPDERNDFNRWRKG